MQYAQKQADERRTGPPASCAGSRTRFRQLEKKWADETEQVQRQVRSRQLLVTVTGPRTLQPVLPTASNSRCVIRNNTPRGGKIHVGLVEAKSGKEVFKKDLVSVNGDAVLDLPADLPLTPDTQFTLVVTGESKDGVQARVSEQLPLVVPLYLTHLHDRSADVPARRGDPLPLVDARTVRGSARLDEDLQLRYRITDPNQAEVFKLEGSAQLVRNGAPVQGPDGKPLKGVGSGEFRIPPGAAGGEYTLIVSEADDRFPPRNASSSSTSTRLRG